MKKAKKDMVNSPPHYTRGNIEVIDFIEDQEMGFTLGNAIKYLSRYRFKNIPIEDLKKAKWYVERLIANEENKNKGGTG